MLTQMARTSSTKRSSRSAEKPAARGRPAGKRAAAKAPPKRAATEARGPGRPRSQAKSITRDIRSLVAEVRDLRSMREKYNQLVAEHDGLVGTLRDLSAELAGSARTAWNDYRSTGKGTGPRQRTARRVRTASADVDAMTAKLMSVVPAEWKTKEAICGAAGLDPKAANTAFRRLVMGYARNGAKVPPALQANGKRGTDGRYRRAGHG